MKLVIDGVVFTEDEELTTLDHKVKMDRPEEEREPVPMTDKQMARILIERMGKS